jgi:pyrrolidone-carboxylate peptidase
MRKGMRWPPTGPKDHVPTFSERMAMLVAARQRDKPASPEARQSASVSRLLAAIKAASKDGRVDLGEIDRIMLQARDGGGLDAAERNALVEASKKFPEETKQRVLQHICAMVQKNAWVNVEVAGQVASIEGRYATMTTGVQGLSARLGMFDSTFSLKGQAATDGTLKMAIAGHEVSVDVKKGDSPAAIFEKLKGQLPPGVTGVTFGGDVNPADFEHFTGAAASPGQEAAHMALYKPDDLHLRPGETPARVVVTGFGAFGTITDNPSATFAQKLAESGVDGAIVEYRGLPVTTEAVDKFTAEMKASHPDVILSLGASSHAQIETKPENWIGRHNPSDPPLKDGAGQIIKDGTVDGSVLPPKTEPGTLRTDLPVETIEKTLAPNSGIAVSTEGTHDRSGYLCNYLGYKLADTFGGSGQERERTTAGFMHIASDTPTDKLHTVLEAATANQLEWRRHHSGQ